MPMKAYSNFDAWKKDQTKPNQALIQRLRKFIHDLELPLEEGVKWGNGVFLKKGLPILYLYGMEKGVQLGFFAGSAVTDPKGRLVGSGKHVRHVPVLSKDDIDEKYFASLIRKAVKIKYK